MRAVDAAEDQEVEEELFKYTGEELQHAARHCGPGLQGKALHRPSYVTEHRARQLSVPSSSLIHKCRRGCVYTVCELECLHWAVHMCI